jgi:hypothetical protein
VLPAAAARGAREATGAVSLEQRRRGNEGNINIIDISISAKLLAQTWESASTNSSQHRSPLQ